MNDSGTFHLTIISQIHIRSLWPVTVFPAPPLPDLERRAGLRLLCRRGLPKVEVPGLLRGVRPRRLAGHAVLRARLQHPLQRLGPQVLVGVERPALRAVDPLKRGPPLLRPDRCLLEGNSTELYYL